MPTCADSPCSPFQIIAMLYWWFWGYKTFTGPRPNLKGQRRLAVHTVTDADSESKDQ